MNRPSKVSVLEFQISFPSLRFFTFSARDNSSFHQFGCVFLAFLTLVVILQGIIKRIKRTLQCSLITDVFLMGILSIDVFYLMGKKKGASKLVSVPLIWHHWPHVERSCHPDSSI